MHACRALRLPTCRLYCACDRKQAAPAGVTSTDEGLTTPDPVGGQIMATFDDTGRSRGWPTRSRDPRQLVSAAAAETQELALTHAREAFRLTQELLGRAEVAGTHRAQLE